MSICSSMPGVRLATAEEEEKRGGKYLHLSPKGGRVSTLICTNGKNVSVLELNHSSSVQSLNRYWDSAILWTAACQASLAITNSRSLFKLMSIELVMPSNHLILYWILLLLPSIFPSIRVFSNELVLRIRWSKSIGVPASASVLPMNIQDWFPLGLTGLISLKSKRISRIFSNPIIQKHPFFGAQPSLWSSSHIHTWLLEKP